MIATLKIVLPFAIAVPIDNKFVPWGTLVNGYEVTFLPPQQSSKLAGSTAKESMSMDGQPAYSADVLILQFRKPQFNRTDVDVADPPAEIIRDVVNRFLKIIRHVTNGGEIRPLNFPHVNWRLNYLNDDGTPLPKATGSYSARGVSVFTYTQTAIDANVWNKMRELYPSYEPPRWRDLLLDAKAAMPNIGLVVALACTSLEVFISEVLNRLIENQPQLKPWWQWLYDRDFLRTPSTEEEFSDLLHILVGKSLKDHSGYWESFRNLRKARNSFVHEGIAAIGGVPISQARALELLNSVWDITELVSSWLPVELAYQTFKFQIPISVSRDLGDTPPGGTSA